MVAEGALVAAGQRRVVGVADEPYLHGPSVLQVAERLLDLPGELFGNSNGLAFVSQWRNQIPDPRPRRLTFYESHLAEFVHPADLYTFDIAINVIGRRRIRLER